MAVQGGTSRLALMQMRFQQKQQQEREQRKIEITSSKSSFDTTDGKSISATLGPGKVRQMFHERRQRSTGIDKSYPLKPLPAAKVAQGNAYVSKTTVTSTFHRQRQRQVNETTTEASEAIIHNSNRTSEDDDIINGNITPEQNNGNHFDEFESEQFGDDVIHTIAMKLPNVGKQAPSPIEDTKQLANIDNIIVRNRTNSSYTQNNNSIKLKPLPIRKTNVTENTTKTLKKSEDDAIKLTTVRTPKTTESGKSTPTRTARKVHSGSSVQSNSPMRSTMLSSPKTSNSARTATPTKMGSVTKKPASPPDGMVACRICARVFNPDRIEKHESICQKTTTKKRKIFDASKFRVQGTEAEKYVKKGTKTSVARAVVAAQNAPPDTTPKKSDWRRKHEEFIQAIRAAKEVKAHLAKGGKLSDLPPPPPSENPDYVQCPHCSRRFNEAAATRHIPKCANMLHNKPKPGAALKKKR